MRVLQSPENPHLTGLLIEVADMEAFKSFLESPEVAAAKAEDGVQDDRMQVLTEVR